MICAANATYLRTATVSLSSVSSMLNRPKPIGLVSHLTIFPDSAASVPEANLYSAFPELSLPKVLQDDLGHLSIGPTGGTIAAYSQLSHDLRQRATREGHCYQHGDHRCDRSVRREGAWQPRLLPPTSLTASASAARAGRLLGARAQDGRDHVISPPVPPAGDPDSLES